ncbi:MAG TPA: DUF6687 family protein [Pyrinomonadaceae bacterium]|nr:DUF6687 family protein [Pyrinomonadaceae bacterium]
MRFQFYSEALDDVPKLSVDGTVPKSIHFSHWQGNTTPAEVKADTSTEITLNLVASPNRAKLTNEIDLVVNNHFDTDGVLSVWTVLNGERALEFRDLLVAAAEAGDFSEHSSDDGVRVSIAIQGADQASPNNISGSPLAGFLAGQNIDDDERAYELVLPEVERLLSDINGYEALWSEGWRLVSEALDSFARGDSRVAEHEASRISSITLAPGLSSPFMAIGKHARGELFVIATPTSGGWYYRLDYPYYSWAETVVRPRIARRDFTNALVTLNDRERNRNGRWQTDNREMTSAVKFLGTGGTPAVSQLEPDEVVALLESSASRVASSIH